MREKIPFRFAEYRNAPGHEDWPQIDNFAAARNLAWSLAICPWVMWADTDDIISPEAATALRRMVEESGDKFDVLVAPYVVPDFGLHDNPRERVVRHGIARWVQPVHECLEPIPLPPSSLNPHPSKWRMVQCPEARIVHDPGPRPTAARNGRNLRILESLAESEMTTSLRYHLFAEHFAMGNIAEGVKAAHAFLLLPEAGPTERFECCLSLSMMCEAPADKIAWLQLCVQECPERREPYVLLSNLMQNAGDTRRAAAYLRCAGAQPLPEKVPWNMRRKMWGWQFTQEYARVARSEGRFAFADAIELNHFIRHDGKISLLHATRGRPQQALDARNLWLERAENPDAIEHIFGCDPDDEQGPSLGGFRHIVQDEGGGPCGAWNMAAEISHGQILVQVSDDMLPPQYWDRLILDAIGGDLSLPRVLRVSDGHRTDGLIVLAIVTRAWWLKQGYLFHPDFFSMYSDNWLTESAQKSGAIIEAREIVFEHRHPVFTGEVPHPTTARSNRLLNYATGARTLEQLRAGRAPFAWHHIPGLSSDDSPIQVHEKIIAALPEKPLCLEVGVAKGRGLAAMATLAQFRGGKARGVDHFRGTNGEAVDYPPDMEAQCRENLARVGFNGDTLLVESSLAAAARVSPLDYVFIDAAHDYENVKADIAAWWPKIRLGGYLAGHDYRDAKGVRDAVDEAFPYAEKHGECWLVQKKS